MKRMRTASALLLALALLLLSLTACFGGLTKKTTAPDTTLPGTAPTVTTPPVTTEDGVAAALSALCAIADEFSPVRAVTAVRYNDPAIGIPLTAQSELSVSGQVLSLEYGYDRLNPIGSPEMTSRETGTLSGSPEELRAAVGELYLFGMDAEGLLFLSLDFPVSAFSAVTLEEGLLLASVSDAAIPSVLGSDLDGAAGLALSVAFEEDFISALSLSYRLGEATVSVTVNFYR